MREPTEHEMEALKALTQTKTLGVMAVMFNGVQRFAIIALHQGPQGPFVQVIGILPLAEDDIINMNGQRASSTPPQSMNNHKLN